MQRNAKLELCKKKFQLCLHTQTHTHKFIFHNVLRVTSKCFSSWQAIIIFNSHRLRFPGLHAFLTFFSQLNSDASNKKCWYYDIVILQCAVYSWDTCRSFCFHINWELRRGKIAQVSAHVQLDLNLSCSTGLQFYYISSCCGMTRHTKNFTSPLGNIMIVKQ